MNDRAVNVLEQYDLTVSRTFKGRGTIICETDRGMCVLKEYRGKSEKLALLNKLQEKAGDSIKSDTLVRNKEGGLSVTDTDGSVYILKKQIEGRECSYKNEEDIVKAFSTMAKLHLKMVETQPEYEMPIFFYGDEMEKHTRECRRVKNHLTRLRTKTDFERRLLMEYDYFLKKAEEVMALVAQESRAEYEAYVNSNGLYCHGDFQYHNVIFPKSGGDASLINFEHFARDTGTRDFYLLFRKISEKNDWSIKIAQEMLDAYQDRRMITPIEWRSLRLRLAYPEKFWKIINFYYNSRKSWVSGRNYEKLESLINQERKKEKLLEKLFD
ncbi:MAG: CotS family spore coat protein [Lachnospiraceae bacterium]|nr:CotS family spore coat protein [Lachnospiraceae bacterium]